jgi:hypothetical protein
MQEIDTFIKQARDKGLSDETIRQNLETNGWDKATIDAGLVGLEVPKAPISPSQATPSGYPTLSPLMTAIHHVILWFFVGSSTVAICGVVATLYGFEISSNALAAMIAVTLITFIPYAVLFGIFLFKVRRNKELVPGKVWSIITICLHSVGAMIAAIVAVVNIVTGGEQMYLVGAGLILLLNLIVITTYSLAAFGFGKLKTLRTIMIWAHLVLLIVMFGILFGLSLLKLGPAKHDEALHKDLTDTVTKIANKTREQNKLPDSIDTLRTNPAITYSKLSDKTYEVCADFQTSNVNRAYSSEYRTIENRDAYVSDILFYASRSGHQCFGFTSDYLQSKEDGIQPITY